jgi:cytochrome c5
VNSKHWIGTLVTACGTLAFTGSLAANTDESAVSDGDAMPARYNETCVVCHETGIDGAPRPGIKSDWSLRLEYGVEELYLNAIDGIGSSMPPRGQCMDCTDDEIRAIVDYMISDLE